MAKFKIKLLTSRLNTVNNLVNFLETPISEFYDQSDVYRHQNKDWNSREFVYCYSFNEKISFHLNGQKELSFSMLRNIWLDNELTLNPFVSQLKNGSQILLIDQYDNEYFFTIKDIKYTLKQSNIVYDYSCQDSFTYQHIRQNNGYTIVNNSDSNDFIGAKGLDWWVKKKIQPECHISYQYISLDNGLYLSEKTHNLCIYDADSNPVDVEKVIKPFYPKNIYPEYYETLPFTVSGSNASSVLIALGEELGLMLNFREHNIRNKQGERTSSFVRYFWFEPKQNEKTADLKYSPHTTIQSFSFSHGGSSLTTALNVESHELGEELISLIPSISPFFSSLFSSQSWKDTLFTEGFFTSICQEKVFLCKDGLGGEDEFRYLLDLSSTTPINNSGAAVSWIDSDNGYIYIALKSNDKNFTIPEYYDKVCLYNSDEQSEIIIGGHSYTAKTSQLEFIVKDGDNYIAYNDTYNLLPVDLMGKSCFCYLRLPYSKSELETATPSIEQSKVILKFYRDATEEDLEFAQIADQCPWLENKIFDFSYLLTNRIISVEEFGALMNELKNNLRIINGQLLYYSREYYQAIHRKTTEIAELVNTIDSIGAAFNSDAVETFKSTGLISNIDYFSKAYATMYARYFKEDDATPIINYKELLTEYFNKYFNAQQRFLKNMYNFRQFFNQKTHWKGDAALYTTSLSLEGIDKANLISFIKNLDAGKNPTNKFGVSYEWVKENNKNMGIFIRYFSLGNSVSFSAVDSSFDLYDDNLKPKIKLYNSDKITEAVIVHKGNFTSFKQPQVHKDDLVRCDKTTPYKRGQFYYKVSYVAKKGLIEWPDKFTSGNSDWYKYKEDENKIWYCSASPDSSWEVDKDTNTWPATITYKTINLTKTFLEVSYREIVNEYLYKKFKEKDDKLQDQLVYQRKETETNVSEWWPEKTIKTRLSNFKPSVFHATVKEQDWEQDICSKFLKEIEKSIEDPSKTFSKTTDQWSLFYISHFPITSVNYTGPYYKQSEWTYSGHKLAYQPANKKGETLTQYVEYLKNLQIYKKENLKEIKNPLDPTQYVTKSLPIVLPENESDYYRRVPKGSSIAASAGVMMLTTALTLGNLPLSALITYATTKNLWSSDTKWKTSGWNTASFKDEPFNKLGYDSYYKGWYDLAKIRYAKSATSYDEWYAIDQQYTDVDLPKEIKIDKEKCNNYTILEEVKYGDDTYYIQCSSHSDHDQYFNYYSKIGLTYSTARSLISNSNVLKKKLTFNNSYLRFVKHGEKIDHQGKYRILALRDSNKNHIVLNLPTGDGEWEEKYDILSKHFDNQSSISKTLYYFIYNSTSQLKLDGLENKATWDDVLTKGSIEYVFNHQGRDILLFQEEDWKEIKVYEKDPSTSTERWNIYTGEAVYNLEERAIVDFSKESDLVEGLYQHSSSDGGFAEIKETDPIVWDGDNKTKFYYFNDLNQPVRAYTILQMKEMSNSFYYLKNESYEKETINQIDQMDMKLYLHQEYYVKKDSNWILDTQVENTFIKAIQSPIKVYSSSQTITVQNENKDYSRVCNFVVKKGDSIGNISNGHFWFNHHSRLEHPILFEEAATIETELTQYWQAAYNASLYCEYFLPSSWQPRVNGDINHYNRNIIVFDESGNPVLSNLYIPDVQIYKENNTIRFPLYELEYDPDYNDGYSIDSYSQNLNIESYTTTSGLTKFKPILDAVLELKEDLDNFVMIDYSSNGENLYKKNYYYNSNLSSGVKWNNFLQNHSNIPQNYSEFNGIYVMMYRILKNQFKDRTTINYNECKNKQNLIWDNLYKKYPGVLLEESYSNSDATTSLELYNLASTAFKDKKNPERGYNISLINPIQDLMIKNNEKYEYERYTGQELKVGEGILINADDYYDTYDDIYNTLSQYLFISDISYDLRKDSDIQVTVNTVKYQDKLIQRLVKLIK